ncbi:protocatechuate 3,4-dioxygenase subunit alpha [Mycobacterium conspicuum]|jgi:protocatechuate 3,4-dioxygenase alpha subunit|uniref:Protocatechuate 3,4-dioxygenase subunit alpha n=1 Tax=Mycobacterium conspicuum TaxID=44010 RepID=A0A1X1TML0_9MYCO|nr:protocatechuate 3,4-dioxygenase subunit alpha [Mycobacterium conspicuum]ORV45825.1 protocatechuate 3,4-dioxygenase subunit alpha [Mycobacterium conspicuum]BBZ38931.1 protocatechuate 3,4-dioxygenase subunit alpha [Mycobacterium conspicuum]
MTELACTPGQTVGPFFGLALPYPGGSELADHADAVRLHGVVYDGAGEPIPDALVELWQPDNAGRIPRAAGALRRDRCAGFTGFGRAATDVDGHYGFTTVTPGSVGGRAPFFAITVFARGLLDRLFTRAYLPEGDLDADPLLASIPAERRATLVCAAETASGRPGYRFDIHLQGPNETVFLTYRDDRR